MRLAVALLAFACANALAAEWTDIASTPYSYDSASLRRDSKGVVVWLKYKADPKVVADFAKANPTIDFSKYSHSLLRFEIGCAARDSRMLDAVEYEESGASLLSVNFGEQLPRKSVIPGSNFEVVHATLCDARRKQR